MGHTAGRGRETSEFACCHLNRVRGLTLRVAVFRGALGEQHLESGGPGGAFHGNVHAGSPQLAGSNAGAPSGAPPPPGTPHALPPEQHWSCAGCSWRNHAQSAVCGGGFPSYGCGLPRRVEAGGRAAPFAATPAAPSLATGSAEPPRDAAPAPPPAHPPALPPVPPQDEFSAARPSRWGTAASGPEASTLPRPAAPAGAPPGSRRGAGRGSASVLPAWMTSGLATSGGPQPVGGVPNHATSNLGPISHSQANHGPSNQGPSSNFRSTNNGPLPSSGYSNFGMSSSPSHGLPNHSPPPGHGQITQAPTNHVFRGPAAAPVRSTAKKGGSWGAATSKSGGSNAEENSAKRMKSEE